MVVGEKPGSPAEVLEHVGVKGMHWGVRKESTSSGTAKKKPRISSDTKKKIAFTAAEAIVVVGAAYTLHRLHKAGKLPANPLSNRHPSVVRDLLRKNENTKFSRREWKHFVKTDRANRIARENMHTAKLLAERNFARSQKPHTYFKNPVTGNWETKVFRRPG